MDQMKEFHCFTKVFNPCRGMVEIFLQSTLARTASEAKQQSGIWERSDERIVRQK